MKNEIIRAIEDLSLATATAKGHDEAMKYAQAVLNLANALAVLERVEELRQQMEKREKREEREEREERGER